MCKRWTFSVVCFVVVCLNLGEVRADFITIQNTGRDPLIAVRFFFDVQPFTATASDFDFIIVSESHTVDPSNIFFPDFNEANPLLPGETLSTFLIPAITGVEFRLAALSLKSATIEAGGPPPVSPFTPVIPDETIYDITVFEDVGLGARISFFSGGTPVPEPSTLAIWSLGAVTLLGLRWRRRKRVG